MSQWKHAVLMLLGRRPPVTLSVEDTATAKSTHMAAHPTGKVDGMGTLIIRRPNDGGGYFRRLKVYIDGTEVAGLRPNETHTVEIADGVHEVRVRMDWVTCDPLSVEVTEGEAVTVEVSLPFSAVIKTFTDSKHAIQVWRM